MDMGIFGNQCWHCLDQFSRFQSWWSRTHGKIDHLELANRFLWCTLTMYICKLVEDRPWLANKVWDTQCFTRHVKVMVQTLEFQKQAGRLIFHFVQRCFFGIPQFFFVLWLKKMPNIGLLHVLLGDYITNQGMDNKKDCHIFTYLQNIWCILLHKLKRILSAKYIF